jgi:hypothetical protein
MRQPSNVRRRPHCLCNCNTTFIIVVRVLRYGYASHYSSGLQIEVRRNFRSEFTGLACNLLDERIIL